LGNDKIKERRIPIMRMKAPDQNTKSKTSYGIKCSTSTKSSLMRPFVDRPILELLTKDLYDLLDQGAKTYRLKISKIALITT